MTYRHWQRYSSIPGHKNWQIENAVWNLAGFLHCALETHWQLVGQFRNDLLRDFMLDFQDFMLDLEDFRKIALEIQHKISYYKVGVSTGGVELRWLGWQFLDGL